MITKKLDGKKIIIKKPKSVLRQVSPRSVALDSDQDRFIRECVKDRSFSYFIRSLIDDHCKEYEDWKKWSS